MNGTECIKVYDESTCKCIHVISGRVQRPSVSSHYELCYGVKFVKHSDAFNGVGCSLAGRKSQVRNNFFLKNKIIHSTIYLDVLMKHLKPFFAKHEITTFMHDDALATMLQRLRSICKLKGNLLFTRQGIS